MALPSPSIIRRSILTLLLGSLLLGTSLFGSTSARAEVPPAHPHTGIADSFSGVQRVVAIGDLHGDHERFVAVLKLCRIVDDKKIWLAGKSPLVQRGDVLDRGPD